MKTQEASSNGVGLRPYVYRRIDGTMSDQPKGSKPQPESNEELPETVTITSEPQIVTELQEPIVELSIFEHFEAIIAKLPVEDIDEEKQRLLDIARDEVESVKRTVNRALTYGT